MRIHTWSPSNKAFNVSSDDSLSIDDDTFRMLMHDAANGKKIVPDDAGYPISVDDVPSESERATDARLIRDAELVKTGWLIERHRDELEHLAGTTLSPQQYSELQTYRQQLRDWPARPHWPDIDMPSTPSWLGDM